MPTVSRSLRNIIASALILLALGLSNTSYAGDTIMFCGKAHAPDVTKVRCSDPSVSDLSPLKGLSSLQTLYLIRTQVKDLSPLQHLIDDGLKVKGP